ncbi:hypothetical protein HAX54_033780, partial [Datura stramonium]|nr:hypothetical protein [Datura stramonium]
MMDILKGKEPGNSSVPLLTPPNHQAWDDNCAMMMCRVGPSFKESLGDYEATVLTDGADDIDDEEEDQPTTRATGMKFDVCYSEKLLIADGNLQNTSCNIGEGLSFKNMTSNRRRDKGKPPMGTGTSQESTIGPPQAQRPSGYDALLDISARFTKRLVDKDNQFAWVASIISEGQPKWAILKGNIHRHDLKFEARMWLDL